MHPSVLFVAVVAISAPPRCMAAAPPVALRSHAVLGGGIDHSPLAENFSGPYLSIGMCLARVKKAVTGLFFHEEQLRVGSTLTVSFSAAGVAAILPHDVAEKVPFGNVTARDVATRFNIAPGSEMTAHVGDTLRACQAPPPSRAGGERHACAASLEDMVRAAMRITLGAAAAAASPAGRVWAAASAVPRAGLPLQPYAVEAVAPLDGDHHVACHDEPYPIGLSMTRAYARSRSAASVAARRSSR
ncbi:hypothetical protein PVAP13_3KG566900, partial [Panicum virgatum]